MRVLLVEDEVEMAQLIVAIVTASGFVVDHVATLDEAAAAVIVAPYALVLLDRRLPDGDGLGLLPALRAAGTDVPVIVLTALDELSDRVVGLDAGADDYLAKPFAGEELLARMRALLRGRGRSPSPPIVCGRLRFDPATRCLEVDGRSLVLKRRELALIEVLLRRSGRVVAREALIDEVYGFDDDVQSNTLDAHISRLRARLVEVDAAANIHTVRGVGYMLDAA